MNILLAILGTLLVGLLGGFLFNYNKKRQLKRDEDLFGFKLEQILKNENLTGKDCKDSALELCRMTKGKIAAGAYFALCDIELQDCKGQKLPKRLSNTAYMKANSLKYEEFVEWWDNQI